MKPWSVNAFGAVAVICLVLAVASIWLFLTEPVTVANAVNDGQVTPLVLGLAQVILGAIEGLLKYL